MTSVSCSICGRRNNPAPDIQSGTSREEPIGGLKPCAIYGLPRISPATNLNIMSNKKTRRGAPAVNAGSMADIAFLLLIFFLVTTTIAEEKGVLVKLPEWSPDPISTPRDEDDVLTVLINKENALSIEDDVVALSRVQSLLAEHIRRPGAEPGQRIVSLRHDRGTSYTQYINVYDALKSGYHDLWDAAMPWIVTG